MTFEEFKKYIIDFRNARNWKQFHDPKNLSAALAIEAAELQELFLWKKNDEINEMLKNENGREKIAHEISDIFVYLLLMCDACEMDILTEAEKKMEHNAGKYPVEKSYNSSKKYTELDN